MNKDFIYILDKVVWILLIAALTTQMLQIAGILKAPKGSEGTPLPKENNDNFQHPFGLETRGKREAAERSKSTERFFKMQLDQDNYFLRIYQNEVITAIM